MLGDVMGMLAAYLNMLPYSTLIPGKSGGWITGLHWWESTAQKQQEVSMHAEIFISRRFFLKQGLSSIDHLFGIHGGLWFDQ